MDMVKEPAAGPDAFPGLPVPPANPVVQALAPRFMPPFMVLGPTVKFPHPVVANGHYGLVAVLHRPGLLARNPVTGLWEGVESSATIDAEVLGLRQVMALAEAAQAPLDRLTCVVWLPDGNGPSDALVCASPDPDALAAAVERAMTERLVEAKGEMAPWIGAYAAAAMAAPERESPEMERMRSIVESVIEAARDHAPILCYGQVISAYDLADTTYLLPALVAAAHEDWSLVVGQPRPGRVTKGGFSVTFQPDPTALMGYRVENIRPSAIYMFIGPLVATFKRCREPNGEYNVTDLVDQFARFLEKKGIDATVVLDIEVRLVGAEG